MKFKLLSNSKFTISIACLVLIMLISKLAYSQPSYIGSYDFPRSNADELEVNSTVLPTSDGGAIWIGSFPYSGSDSDWDGRIVKINNSGVMEWEKNSFSSGIDFLFDGVEVSDGYVFVGQHDGTDGTFNFWLIKVDFDGNTTWERNYGWDDRHGVGLTIEKSYNNRLLIGGYWNTDLSNNSPQNRRSYLLTLESDGTLNNDFTFTFSGNCINKIVQSHDNNYYLFGEEYVSSNNQSCSGFNDEYFGKDLYVQKIDGQLDEIWKLNYDQDSAVNHYIDGISTPTGFAFLVHTPCNSDNLWDYLVVGNSNGNINWEKDFGTPGIEGGKAPFSLVLSCENEIVIGDNFFDQLSGMNFLSFTKHSQFSTGWTAQSSGIGTYSGLAVDSDGNFILSGNFTGNARFSKFSKDPDCGTTNPSSCNIYSENFDNQPEGDFPSNSNPFWEHLYIGSQNQTFGNYFGRVDIGENDLDCSDGVNGKSLVMQYYYDDFISYPQLVNKVNLTGQQSCYKVSINPATVYFTDGDDTSFKISFLENWDGPIPLEGAPWNPNVARALTVEFTGNNTLIVNDITVKTDLWWKRDANFRVDFSDIEFTFNKNERKADIKFPDLDYTYTADLIGSGNIEGVLYEAFNTRSVYAIDCICASTCSPSDITIDIGDECGSSGQTVSIPVSVRNFSQLTSLDVQIELSNPSIGQITGIRSSNALSNLGGSVLASDMARVNWFSGPTVDLNDNTVIFYVDVRLTGSVGAQSAITITSSSGEVGTNGTSITPISNNGSVCIENSEIRICGKIAKSDGSGVQNVQVVLSGNESRTTMTDSNGDYCFEGLQSGSSYQITPSKDDDHKNGLTGGDLSRIQRHILGIRDDLNTPYKLIAADVNLSKSLSGGDLSRIQRVILELDPRFLLVDSWKFVNESYQFPDPLNPQTPDYPEKIELTNVSSDQTSIDFIAMKMGDVNDSNNGQKSEIFSNSKLATINFIFEDKNVGQGDEFVSNITVEGWTNITSANTSFQWDHTKFEFIDVVDLNTNLSLDPALNFQKNKVSEGKLGLLWFRGAGTSLQSNSKIFGIKFKAIGSAGSSSEFKLANSPIAQEFEDLNDLLDISETVGTLTIQGQQNQLSVSPTSLNVGSDSGQASFNVSSNTNWNASKTASWFWLSPENGTGNGTVQVNYQENTSTSSRSATITVSANGVANRTVTITQAGAMPSPFLSTNLTNLNYDAPGGSRAINVSSNISWTASDNSSWLIITPVSGSNNGSITVTAQANSSTNSRTGSVTLKGNGVSDVVINIAQSGATPAPFLSVNTTSLNFDAAGGNGTLNVSSNITWNLIDNAGWLSLSPTSGSNNGVIAVTCQQNTSTSSRTGRITLSGSGVSDRIVTVTQQGGQALNLSVTPSTINITADEGQASFNINSNTSWTANKTTPWFWLNPGSGSGNGTVSVNYQENNTTQERVGTITVSATGLPDKTVTVRQAGQSSAPFLDINPSDRTVNNGVGTFNVNVSSNVSWNVTETANWVTVNPNSGSNNGTFNISYQSNPSQNSREAIIRVNASGISSKELRLTQSGSAETININPAFQTVNRLNGIINISVESNSNWVVSSDQNWVIPSQNSGSNMASISLEYELNPTINSRVAQIKFTTPGGSFKTFTLTQSGGSVPLNNTCGNRNNISSLFGKATNVPQVSRIYDNTYANSQNSDLNYGYDCFDDGELNKTLWFRFVGDGFRYRIRTIRCNADNYITGGDTEMAIYKGNTCVDPVPAYCNEDFDFDNDLYYSNIQIPTGNAQDYTMMIDGCFCWEDLDQNQFTSFGEFCIEVTKLGSSSTESISNSENIKFYPNPASNEVTIEFDLPNEKVNQVSLIDVVGKLVTDQKVDNLSRGKLKLELQNQPNGIYHLFINTDKGVFTDKLILQR